MKKRQLEKLEKEVSAALETLQDFLDGRFMGLTKYPPSDPEFRKRVLRLHGLSICLYSATEDLHFTIKGAPFNEHP